MIYAESSNNGGGIQSLYFNTSNNRISGWSYDAAGNLLNDTVHSYTFDAENKISKVDNVSAYVYDGEGHRVKKLVGENTRFVYGIGGELAAEFDGTTGSLKKEYVYGGGSLITIEPTAVNANGTQYTTSDHLGSPRVITNSSGSVVTRHDYMPCGEEIGAGTGGRTAAMGFSGGGDNNRKKFTGYERDTETGLDFAQARYFSSTQGRFTSADSVLGSIGNPQSLNRYAYVGNNPLNFSDPTGHTRFDASSSTGGDQGGYMSPNNPDFDPGLPQRYEDEIARIKELVAEDEENASEPAPQPDSSTHEEGHSLDADRASGSGTISGTVTDAPQNPAQKPGGGKTTDSAKLAVDPCAGIKVSDLDYSGEHFTERHILDTDPAYKDRSKYAYSPWFGLRLAGEPDPQKRLQMARQMVIDYDNWTFQGGGKYQSSLGSNIVFVYGFPKRSGPGLDVEWFTGFVGSNQLHAGELTNVNTLVLAPDCRRVITSYPGFPGGLFTFGGTPAYYRKP